MHETGKMKTVTPIETDKPAHPILFLILALPSGILQGYINITLAYLYAKAGISVEDIAALIAVTLLPPLIKFLWAPLIDITFTVKKWYAISTVIIGVSILALSIIHINKSIPAIVIGLVLLANFALTFETMSINSLMAYDTSNESKGRASGYFQGGSTGGIGLGGGAGLWLATHLASPWIAGALLAFVCLACCLAIFYVNEPQAAIRVKKVSQTMKNLFKDIWLVFKARDGILALFLCVLPIGTGAAGTLFAAVANDWKASPDTVAQFTGTLSGLITVAGCLLGGWLCDIMNRRTAYILFGLIQVACAVGMAFCPHTELMYKIWTSAYSLSNGLAYAGFTAFVLDAIGKGAAATKYNIYAGLSNGPIYLMTLIEGWAHTKWGASGLLNTEAAVGAIAIVLFFVVNSLSNLKGRAAVTPLI